MQNKVGLKHKLVLSMCKCMVAMVTRYMSLKNGEKSLVSTMLLIIEHKTWYQIKA